MGFFRRAAGRRPITDADLAEVARRAVAAVDWEAFVRADEPGEVVQAAARALDLRGVEHARGVFEDEHPDSQRAYDALFAATKAAWEANLRAIEDNDVEALVAIATGSIDWAEMEALWSGEETFPEAEVRAMQSLRAFIGAPEFVRMSKHPDRAALARRVADGVHLVFATRREEWLWARFPPPPRG